ncbi:MAG: transposase [Bacteroides sp.]|nr:transposase [Bacteroides sp.]
MERQYRDHLSGYMDWDQRKHAQDWILFPKNMGSHIGIDEVALSRGELYTVVINKAAKGKEGTIIAIVEGTDATKVSNVLLQMSRRRRFQAREITLDMSASMGLIARTCFPAARQVIDRFHVQQLAFEAVQEMRIKARWETIDIENTAICLAKAKGELYVADVYENGDTTKQLLARSRYLLFKKESLWTLGQRKRAEILFKEYPNIKKAYYLSMQLGAIYHQTKHKDVALTKLARWYDRVEKTGFLSFGTVARTIQTHYLNIINFFKNRSTNAAAESFNAKIKNFRRVFRGVKDKAFFLFRLSKLYA